MSLLIGHTNHLATATLTASSELAAGPIENIALPHGATSEAWQTAATVTTADFTADMGADVEWRIVGLFRTNLTDAATVRWRFWTSGGSGGYTSPTEDTTAVANVGDWQQSVFVLDAPVTARYARCDIVDSGNPMSTLIVPLAFAGPAWEPEASWYPASAERLAPERTELVSRGGQQYRTTLFTRRTRSLVMSAVRATERDDLLAVEVAAARGDNILVVPRSTGDLTFEPIFGQVEFGATGYSADSPYRFRPVTLTATERL